MKSYPAHTWTDPRVQRRPSPIGGTGGFATASIQAGEVVQIFGGTVLTQAQMDATFRAYDTSGRYCNAMQIGEGLHLADLADTLDVPFNHSCDSTLWMADENTVIARRDIHPGEELTVDYALQTVQPVDLIGAPCRCGSPLCRRTITGNDWLLPDLQARYRGHFSPFINQLINRT